MSLSWFGDNILLTDAAVRNGRGRAFGFMEQVKCQILSSSLKLIGKLLKTKCITSALSVCK